MSRHAHKAAKATGACEALARAATDLLEGDDSDHSNMDTVGFLLAKASKAAYDAGTHLRLSERKGETGSDGES